MQAENFAFEEQVGNSLVVREPVGVVGCITPWNYPLHQIAAKVASALAAGCTVVLKPSEVAPLDAFILAEIIDEVGLPAGVFNLVTGTGPVVGEAIAAHPDVDMVSFTGSTRAGKRVAELGVADASSASPSSSAASRPTSCSTTSTTRSSRRPCVTASARRYLNSGQTCTALTRMLVPQRQLAEAERIAADEVETKFQPSATRSPSGAQLGPLSSRGPARAGARLHPEGHRRGRQARHRRRRARPRASTQGYFVQPTVFSDVSNDMTIAQEEIFGPVLSIMPYDDEDDAVRIANDTIYGLSGGVWSGDAERAKKVARRIRTGQVEVNGGALQPERAVRWLQAVGLRPRVRPVRPRGVPRGQVHAAVVLPFARSLASCSVGRGRSIGSGPFRWVGSPDCEDCSVARTRAVTMLFCDLVASTERRARLGDDRFDAFTDRFLRALRAAVDNAGGREVKSAGDGLMVVFESSVADTVACAIDMHVAMRGVDAEDPPLLRIGISAGEVRARWGRLRRDADRRGRPARGSSRSWPDTRERDRPNAGGQPRRLPVRDVGALTLKGIPDPLPAVEVLGDDVRDPLPDEPRSRNVRRWPVVGAAVLLVIVLAGLGLARVRSHSSPHAAASTGVVAPKNYVPQYREASCQANVVQVAPEATCGTLTVPEDRSKPAGKQISLQVYRAPPRMPGPAVAPSIDVCGCEDAGNSVTRDHAELIHLALRGFSGSDPELMCPEVSAVRRRNSRGPLG